jgi:hypothetical protein
VYGGGVGYRFGESARLGFNVEFAERRARPADRTYKRTRTYAALSYDF